MKTRILALVVAAATFAPAAFADVPIGKTRAEVRKELIEAQQNGLRYVTDTSYPDVSPIHAPRLKQASMPKAENAANDVGGTLAESRDSGPGKTIRGMPHLEGCVGPISFCQTYFGS